MSDKERYYAEKYLLIREADKDNCPYAACCSTCRFRLVNQSFEEDYCVVQKRNRE